MQERTRLRPLVITEEELRQLRQWAQARSGSGSLALRARIVLACGGRASNSTVARELRVSAQTVGKWRTRFVVRRLHGLVDEPRCGAPRSISDALVEAVVAKTLHESPPGGLRWSSRQLAAALGISQRAVLRIWRTFDLR
jgi:transposase